MAFGIFLGRRPHNPFLINNLEALAKFIRANQRFMAYIKKTVKPDNIHPSGHPRKKAEHIAWLRVTIGVTLILVFVASYLFLQKTGAMSVIMDAEKLHHFVISYGSAGPFIIIGIMTVAIVINPIPSAPIALTAGLAFGHTIGTVLIIVGALLGAMIAFFIGRLVGHEILYKWFGDKLQVKLLGSQNTLMGIIFVSRLLPFISFDIVSYAAGLTEIKVWRFTLATLVGITPTSFLLAHFGSEIGSADMKRITVSILGLGLLTILPFLVKVLINKFRKVSTDKKL